MDMSDVAVRHAVAFNSININHSIELSSSAVQVAREVRIAVIVVVLGYTTTSILKSILEYRRRPEA